MGRKFRLGFVALLLACIGVAQPAFAAKFYVDGAIGELKPEEKVSPARPAPVQLIFAFNRNGIENPRATKAVKAMVVDALKKTGAFTDIGDSPVDSGAVLSVTINNVVSKDELDKVKGKAFGAGLSFGLASGFVALDRYEVTLDFVPVTAAKPLETVVHHAIAMKWGNTGEPTGMLAVKDQMDAVKTMIRQSVDHGINALVTDPAFPRT